MPTAKGKRQTMDNLIEPSRATRPRLEDVVVEAFGEDAPFAQNRLAAESVAPGASARRAALRSASPPTARTVDPVGNRATRWACAVHAHRADRNDGAVAFAQRSNRAKTRRQQLRGAKRRHGSDFLSKPSHPGASTSSKVSQTQSSTPIHNLYSLPDGYTPNAGAYGRLPVLGSPSTSSFSTTIVSSNLCAVRITAGRVDRASMEAGLPRVPVSYHAGNQRPE